MQKLLILTITLISISFSVQAQIINNYGVKLSIISSDLSYNNFPTTLETERKLGFIGGAFVEWFNNPIFSMITQIEYAQKGSSYEIVVTGESDPTPIGTKTYNNNLYYISLPVYVKAKITFSSLIPYLFAGARVDFLLSYSTEFDSLIFSKFKNTAFGGVLGFGIEPLLDIPLNPFLEFRYDIDFTNSYDQNGMTIKNNAFDVLIGITF
jgi:hypothetical protein